MNVETAQRLADLRRSKGFSQEGLAQKLGLSRQAISKWERAESSPDTENLISLARLYGVSLDELLNPSEEIEDDIEFENEDRARQREAEAAERARAQANAATAQVVSAGATDPAQSRGPFQSFPYWAVCWLLFFLLFFAFGFGPFAALIFLTIPIYHWVARALDGDWARGDIQVGPAAAAHEASAAAVCKSVEESDGTAVAPERGDTATAAPEASGNMKLNDEEEDDEDEALA